MSKTINQQITFNASPRAVFEALLDAGQHSAFTGAPAEIEREVGGAFSVYGGHVQGITVDFKQDERIVQAWRAKCWPEGAYSLATFQLTPEGDKTKLSFVQLGVPVDAYEDINKGWETMYWSKMKTFLAR